MPKKKKLLLAGFALLVIAPTAFLFFDSLWVKYSPVEAVICDDLPGSDSAQQAIAGAHLFGSADGAVQIDTDLDKALNDTLELKGTSKSGEEGYTGAYIAQKGQEEVLYRVGDTLPGGGVLEQVADDSVTIKKDNKSGKLYFSEQETIIPPIPENEALPIPME